MIIKSETGVVQGGGASVTWGEARAGEGGPLVPVLLLEANGVRVMVVFQSTDEARAFGAMAGFEAVTCDHANQRQASNGVAASPIVRPDGGPLGGGAS